MIEVRGPWGDALASSFSEKKTVHEMRARGIEIQRHNKQFILSGLIVLEEKENISNRKWINEVAPHTPKQGPDKCVNKCKEIRQEFDMRLKKVLHAEQAT